MQTKLFAEKRNKLAPQSNSERGSRCKNEETGYATANNPRCITWGISTNWCFISTTGANPFNFTPFNRQKLVIANKTQHGADCRQPTALNL